jgi:hypothetical protein
MSVLDWLRRLNGTVAPPEKRAAENAPCPCGSGRKYKRCCLERDEDAADEELRARLSEAYSAGNRDRPAFGGPAAAARGFRRWAELSRLSIRRRLRRDRRDP